MKITNKLNLPEAIVKACTTEQHNKDGCLSATTLLKGTKQILLEQRHWDELEDDVSERIWALFGTAAHELLQSEGKNEFSEVKVELEVDGVTITGIVDNYDMASGVITDWKTASVYKILLEDTGDWKSQGSIYGYLLRKNGFAANKCRFVALLKDHSKSKAKREAGYPKSPLFVYEFELDDFNLSGAEQLIKYAVGKYKKYLNEPDDMIPACSPEQRWETPTRYAVMKNGRKSAVRVLDTYAEALNYIEDFCKGTHSIEKRPGECKRCEHYCLVNEFCNFYKELKGRQ